MVDKKVKQDFIHSGEELKKKELGKNFDSDFTAREQPSSQSQGRAGYSKPQLDAWTDEELKAHLTGLGADTQGQDREAMIEAIISNSRRDSASA